MSGADSALLLLTAARPTLPRLLGLAWIGALLGCSYTPNLSSWLLLISSLAWFSILAWRTKRRELAVKWLSVALVVGGVGSLSFLTRMDLFKPEGALMKQSTLAAISDGLSVFFFGAPQVFIPAVLYLPLMIALVLGLAGRLGFPSLVVSMWIVATILAACILRGYSLRPMSIEMFRALVVIPPLLVLAGWAGLRACAARGINPIPRWALIGLCLFLSAQVFWNLAWFGSRHDPSLHEMVYADLLDKRAALGISVDEPPIIVLSSFRGEFGNTGDFLPYFFPGHQLIRDPAGGGWEPPPVRPAFFYVDAATSVPNTMPWPGAGQPTVITFEHPRHPHQMYGWVATGVVD